MMSEEVKDQLPALWDSYKNEKIWEEIRRENIKLRVESDEVSCHCHSKATYIDCKILYVMFISITKINGEKQFED